MATQPERLASLETTTSIAKWTLGIFIPLVIGWGAFITVNLIAMKQQLADGGSAKLVTELRSPKSPELLQANLITVVASVQTARAQGIKPNDKSVAALSTAVEQVIRRDSKIPESWQAASALISYRSSTRPNPQTAECGSAASPADDYVEEGLPTLGLGLIFKNCTVTLDDAPQIENQKPFSVMRVDPSHAVVGLVFRNVLVVYRVGRIIPADILTFTGCKFDFHIPGVPVKGGETLVKDLLEATSIDSVKSKISAQAM